MKMKSETTRNHTLVNNLTMTFLSRLLMKHATFINSEKLPENPGHVASLF